MYISTYVHAYYLYDYAYMYMHENIHVMYAMYECIYVDVYICSFYAFTHASELAVYITAFKQPDMT